LEINDIELDRVKSAGFSLSEKKEISIYAVGSGEKTYKKDRDASFMSDPGNMFAYAWILNAKSREMVWRMSYENSRENRGKQYTRVFKGDIALDAGDYEVYYSAKKPDYAIFDDGFFSLGRFFNKLFKDEDFYEETRDSWEIEIRGIDAIVHPDGISKYHKAIKDQAIVSMTDLDDSEFRQEGFKLKKGAKLEIYAVGETHGSDVFDYGWIVNAENSEKIWETLPDKGDYAGGAIKNTYWRETIYLESGSYWVYFVMDDSHSSDNWNANPPYDPDFYGITISWASKKFDPTIVEPLIKQKVTPIIELTRLGDDEFVQEGFKLSSPMQLRIYALGEGRSGEMFDYGWIIDLQTGEKIWEMTYNRTRNAGGADKNRLVDEVITLAEGSYMVYYVTDGSHSYRNWNSAPPYNPTNWGITIYPADPKINLKNIEKLEKELLAENIISQIIRVRDGRLYRERFELDKKTSIRIYAIGEGDWDEMYDHGWIEDSRNGKKVWEMTYDETRWAGGAKKNRKVDEVIQLPAGRYLLFYNTDGSHSFNDWNADPPDDPIHYGIILFKTK
jgi:hypothetical protein